MSPTVRPLADDELPAAWELGRLAFGGPAAAPDRALRPVAGLLRLGAFDERGRLVGKATDPGHRQWWGGREVATADVSEVAVLPEYRGAGVARALLTDLLARGRERGTGYGPRARLTVLDLLAVTAGGARALVGVCGVTTGQRRGAGRAGVRPGRPGRAGPARLRAPGPAARLLLTG